MHIAPSAAPLSAQPMHVAVLVPSYEETHGVFSAVDADASPEYFFAPNWPSPAHPEQKMYSEATPFTFEKIFLKKSTAYGQIRDAVKSKRFGCFFNLCDGARDEDRAGVEVIHALESLGVPFTGAQSKHYEPSKTEMKMQLQCRGICTPKGFVVRSLADVHEQCSFLRFPVIVKHESGYGSVNMSKKSKCCNMAELEEVAASFLEQFDAALVEEFIAGEEATVLACADPTEPDGIKVYPPVVMTFPEGEDFKHFDLKWSGCDDIAWRPMDPSHRAYEQTMELGRVAFQQLMDGSGYGRSDVRIDAVTGEAYFLELNPNCGIMYDYGQEGSADWILRLTEGNGAGHRAFIAAQIYAAIERADAQRPAYQVAYSPKDNSYVMQAVRTLTAGAAVLADLATIRVAVSGASVVCQAYDRRAHCWQTVTHSTAPSACVVADGYTVTLRTTRVVAAGEALTIDFAQASAFCNATDSVILRRFCSPSMLAAPKVVIYDCSSSDAVDELGAESVSGSSCGAMSTDGLSRSHTPTAATIAPAVQPPNETAVFVQ